MERVRYKSKKLRGELEQLEPSGCGEIKVGASLPGRGGGTLRLKVTRDGGGRVPGGAAGSSET